MKSVITTFALLLAIASTPAIAAGDAESGKSKSAVCAACHAADGNSVVPQWPKLAGQHVQYLERQLMLVKTGERDIPEMNALVASMSEQDIADISAYYSVQTISTGQAEDSKMEMGQSLYRAGNPETGVPACSSCHGPNGRGNPIAGYASLAGQHSVYIQKSLTKFRNTHPYGEADGPSRIMSAVAINLKDDEIAALASYIQGLHTKP